MRFTLVGSAAALILVLSGCTGAPPVADPTTAAPLPSATTTPTLPPTPGPTPDPAAFIAVDPSEFFVDGSTLPAAFGGWDTSDVNFLSPSRNLGCAILGPEKGSLWGCAISEHSWEFEKDSSDDYCYDSQVPCGSGIEASGEEPTHPRKRSDPGYPAAMALNMDDEGSIRVLQYGESVTFNGVTCYSEETGVTCENAASGHGFVIARDRNDLY